SMPCRIVLLPNALRRPEVSRVAMGWRRVPLALCGGQWVGKWEWAAASTSMRSVPGKRAVIRTVGSHRHLRENWDPGARSGRGRLWVPAFGDDANNIVRI